MNQLRVTAITIIIISLQIVGCSAKKNVEQNWTNYVRTAGHGVNMDNIDDIIKDATETHLFGIEIDNSLTGYYDSFLDPTDKLKSIKALAEAAHKIDNYAFVYTEGLESITKNAADTQHTFFKDHPDWIQRKRTGEPAVFGGGSAFWISEGDEDVWLSPFATEWRDMYMERIRQIAGTDIDGVFIDIPYWMTHFDDWEDSWASFDDYTVEAFRQATGVDAKKDFVLGDFNDPDFIKWVDFRIETLTDFMADVDKNAKSVNPNIMTIAEIYPGLGEEAVRVGADVYQMYDVVDVVAHEYGAGGWTSASRTPIGWFEFMTGMFSFRAFAEGKATWMLSYSWDGEEEIEPRHAQENLAMSELVAGTNPWDARRHVMSGSNDIEGRKAIYGWIADHEDIFYKPRTPINPVGIYFSPRTRDYFADAYAAAYNGMMYQLLQTHTEFQVVTPRTLDEFEGSVLILSDVKVLTDGEVASLEQHWASGLALVVTGETGAYNAERQMRTSNPLHDLFELDPTVSGARVRQKNRYLYVPGNPGLDYFNATSTQFNEHALTGDFNAAEFYLKGKSFMREVTELVDLQPAVIVETSPAAVVQIARVDGVPHVFLANFTGLVAGKNPNQTPITDVRISFEAEQAGKVFLLPIFGDQTELETSFENGRLTVVVPEIFRGAVLWVE